MKRVSEVCEELEMVAHHQSMDWLKALFADFLCFFNGRICRGFNILPPIPESWKSIKNHSPWHNHGALWSWLKLRFHSLLIVRFLVTSSEELQMVSARMHDHPSWEQAVRLPSSKLTHGWKTHYSLIMLLKQCRKPGKKNGAWTPHEQNMRMIGWWILLVLLY